MIPLKIVGRIVKILKRGYTRRLILTLSLFYSLINESIAFKNWNFFKDLHL